MWTIRIVECANNKGNVGTGRKTFIRN